MDKIPLPLPTQEEYDARCMEILVAKLMPYLTKYFVVKGDCQIQRNAMAQAYMSHGHSGTAPPPPSSPMVTTESNVQAAVVTQTAKALGETDKNIIEALNIAATEISGVERA